MSASVYGKPKLNARKVSCRLGVTRKVYDVRCVMTHQF